MPLARRGGFARAGRGLGALVGDRRPRIRSPRPGRPDVRFECRGIGQSGDHRFRRAQSLRRSLRDGLQILNALRNRLALSVQAIDGRGSRIGRTLGLPNLAFRGGSGLALLLTFGAPALDIASRIVAGGRGTLGWPLRASAAAC